jgi:hypothetical protein
MPTKSVLSSTEVARKYCHVEGDASILLPLRFHSQGKHPSVDYLQGIARQKIIIKKSS